MNTSSTIFKIEQLDFDQLDEELKASLTDVEWRIRRKRFNELYVEMQDNAIIAVGIKWENSFHPYAKYIHFTPSASDELVHILLSSSEPHDPIIFSCGETEHEKLKRINAFPFQLFRRTFIETYDVVDLLQKLASVELPKDCFSLKQIMHQPTLEEELFQLLKHCYEQTHLDNPSKELDWQTWREILLDDSPDLELSNVAVCNARVNAYIFLHPINETHYEVGWIGMKGELDLLPLLKQALMGLHDKGVQTVEFEIDDTNFQSWQFADLLDFKSKQSWNSYMLKK